MLDGQIFKLFGLLSFLTGLGLFFYPKYYKRMFYNLVRNEIAVYFIALLVLALGFLLVAFHNIWVYSWTVIITILGWLMLIKGGLALVFPKFFIRMAKHWFKKCFKFCSLVSVILGLFFLILGFLL